MIYTRTNPVGIDAVIQPLQESLYDLCESWGDIDGFGRVYLNRKGDRIVPEHYNKDGEYREVLTNDMKVATYFFVESDVVSASGSCLSKNNVDLYFFVNVKEAKPDVGHYADEEVRLDVLRIAKDYFSQVESTVKGENALSEMTTEGLDFIYPYFIFKITGMFNNY